MILLQMLCALTSLIDPPPDIPPPISEADRVYCERLKSEGFPAEAIAPLSEYFREEAAKQDSRERLERAIGKFIGTFEGELEIETVYPITRTNIAMLLLHGPVRILPSDEDVVYSVVLKDGSSLSGSLSRSEPYWIFCPDKSDVDEIDETARLHWKPKTAEQGADDQAAAAVK